MAPTTTVCWLSTTSRSKFHYHVALGDAHMGRALEEAAPDLARLRPLEASELQGQQPVQPAPWRNLWHSTRNEPGV